MGENQAAPIQPSAPRTSLFFSSTSIVTMTASATYSSVTRAAQAEEGRCAEERIGSENTGALLFYWRDRRNLLETSPKVIKFSKSEPVSEWKPCLFAVPGIVK